MVNHKNMHEYIEQKLKETMYTPTFTEKMQQKEIMKDKSRQFIKRK